MKWKGKDPATLRKGEERIVRRFIVFPMKLYGDWRWLEWAFIRQVVVEDYISEDTWGSPGRIEHPYLTWKNMEWIGD